MSQIMQNAQSALDNGKTHEALELFNQAVTDNPDSAVAYQGVARCLFRLKDFEGTVTMSNKALKIDPTLSFPHLLLAQAFNELGNIDKSREEVRVAYSLDPNSSDVLSSLGYFLLIDKKIEEGISILEKFVEKNPNNANAHYNLIITYSTQKNFNKVFDHVRALYRIHPSIENGIRLFIAFMNKWRLFRILFGILIYLLGVVALLFENPILIAIFILVVGLLISAGIYLKVKERRK